MMFATASLLPEKLAGMAVYMAQFFDQITCL